MGPRQALHVRAGLCRNLATPDDALLAGARTLFSDAVREAWNVDGALRLIFTVELPVNRIIRKRMLWVHWAGDRRRGVGQGHRRRRIPTLADLWWRHAERHFVDRNHGSWHHELIESNQPSEIIRIGKADLYHPYQATLLRDLPVRASVVQAVADTRWAEAAPLGTYWAERIHAMRRLPFDQRRAEIISAAVRVIARDGLSAAKRPGHRRRGRHALGGPALRVRIPRRIRCANLIVEVANRSASPC